jgi:putative DNA primase/helicase
VDTVLIAESPLQGTRKSSAFRALAVSDDWFASDLPDIKHKDSVHHLLGPWIIELDELDALNRKEATSIKGFISRQVDRARLSFRRNADNYPRRVVFCGTTNEDTYNTDATGGRRFWPFRVRDTIRVDLIEQWRDQLWAEAKQRYLSKETWWLDDDELEAIAHEEQSKRFKGGVHLEPVRAYLESEVDTSVDEILDHLDIPVANRSQVHQNDVARCLQHIGWERRRVWRTTKGEKRRAYRYFPKTPLGPTPAQTGARKS